MNNKSIIEFEPENHKYFNTKTGEEYISCTTLLGLFKPKFDSIKMSSLCAKKQGKTSNEILAEWEANAKKSTDYGTEIHAGIEGYIKNDKELISNNKYNEICKKGYDKLISIIGDVGIHSEELLWNHNYKIAGQSDIVQYINGFRQLKTPFGNHVPTINVIDIKTNNKINFHSEYDEYMKYPLEHLHNCNYNNYALQLSLYSYMLQTMNPGMKIGKLALLHFDRNIESWKYIPCPYMLYEVKSLLKVYKETKLNNEK